MEPMLHATPQRSHADVWREYPHGYHASGTATSRPNKNPHEVLEIMSMDSSHTEKETETKNRDSYR